jgi:hypothetical protein
VLSADQSPASFALRAGDTLLLDVDEPTGTPVAYDLDDDGLYEVQSTAGVPVTMTFPDAAISTMRIMSDLDGDGQFDEYSETTSLLEVTALSVNFDGPVASEVGFRREKGVEVYPLEARNVPLWGSTNPDGLEVSVMPKVLWSDEVRNNVNYNPEYYGQRLYVRAAYRGDHFMLSRTPSGQVIGYQEVDDFVFFYLCWRVYWYCCGNVSHEN